MTARTRLDKALNIEDLRRLAHRRVPGFALASLESGAEAHTPLRWNREVFERWRFVPDTLVDASRRSLEAPILGAPARMPLVVAPPGEHIAAAKLRCFLAQGRQGVNFTAGVWHHPLLALHRESDFLVIDRDDPDNNCETQGLDAPCHISLERAASLRAPLTGALSC